MEVFVKLILEVYHLFGIQAWVLAVVFVGCKMASFTRRTKATSWFRFVKGPQKGISDFMERYRGYCFFSNSVKKCQSVPLENQLVSLGIGIGVWVSCYFFHGSVCKKKKREKGWREEESFWNVCLGYEH